MNNNKKLINFTKPGINKELRSRRENIVDNSRLVPSYFLSELIKNILHSSQALHTKEVQFGNKRKSILDILNIKERTINKINSIQIKNDNKKINSILSGYNNDNKLIYNWSNNNIIHSTGLDNIIKHWLKLLFNIRIQTIAQGQSGPMVTIDNQSTKDSNINQSKSLLPTPIAENSKFKGLSTEVPRQSRGEITKIHTSDPIFIHTNDSLNIIIRILLPYKGITKYNYHYITQIFLDIIVSSIKDDKLIGNHNKTNTTNKIYSVSSILSKIYNKKVIVSPIIVKTGGMNEFIASLPNSNRDSSNIIINKYNKYIINKSTIIRNNYININSLHNILYYNYISQWLKTQSDPVAIYYPGLSLNKILTILPNLTNRYITGYNIQYTGKLPKADSSSRTTHKLFTIGTSHNSNIISNTYYTVRGNGLANTKAILSQL